MKTTELKLFLKKITYLVLLLVFSSCSIGKPEMQFQLIPSEESGITFSNDLTYTDDFNVYKYRNFYNGGGVAVGDVNNDSLVDLYFLRGSKWSQML